MITKGSCDLSCAAAVANSGVSLTKINIVCLVLNEMRLQPIYGARTSTGITDSFKVIWLVADALLQGGFTAARVSWDVHLSSTVFCDHLISGCTCRCDVARQPRDDSESPLNACLWERSLKKLQFIQITLDEKLKHLCCISISIVGYGFLHSNIKKRFMSVLKYRNLLLCVQEVPSSLTVRRHFYCSHLQKRHKKLTT